MKFHYPPSNISGPLQTYLTDLVQALNSIPQISYFSGTDPITSGVTGVASNMVVNISPQSNVSRLWIHDGSAINPDTSSWRTIA